MAPNDNQTSEEHLYRKTFLILLPSFIFLILFMIIGLFGNAIVIYIYGWRLKNSTIQVMMLLLAAFDMCFCVVGLPLQIVEIILYNSYPSSALCKGSNFITFYCCNASILTLLTICVLRYQKVCRFNKPQVTLTQSRWIARIICFLSLILTIPAALFFDVKEFEITQGFKTRSCLWHGSYEKLWIYFMTLLVFNVIILTIMFALYGMIWVKVRKQDLMQLQHGPVVPRKPRTKNRIFVSITALFAIGYLPGLLLGVSYPLYEDLQLSDALNALRNVVYRMWILNSTLNPVIYGFFGVRFRREAKIILTRSLSRNKSVSSASEYELPE